MVLTEQDDYLRGYPSVLTPMFVSTVVSQAPLLEGVQ